MTVLGPFALVAILSFSGCLEKTGVTLKGVSASKSQTNCALPDAVAVKNVGRRLAASEVEVSGDFCAKRENYECYVRRFGPTIVSGPSTVDECGYVGDLGGEVCLRMRSHAFNTREASHAPGTPSSARLSGGEFNRSEYVCHNVDLRDADVFLAVGEGDRLTEALAASYAKCAGVAPRLATGK